MRFRMLAAGEQECTEAAADRGQDDVVHGAAKLPLDRLDVIERRPGQGVPPLLADGPAQGGPGGRPHRWGQLRDGPHRVGRLPDGTAGMGHSAAQRGGFPHRKQDHVQCRLSGEPEGGGLRGHGPAIDGGRRGLGGRVVDHAVQVAGGDPVDHAVMHL